MDFKLHSLCSTNSIANILTTEVLLKVFFLCICLIIDGVLTRRSKNDVFDFLDHAYIYIN